MRVHDDVDWPRNANQLRCHYFAVTSRVPRSLDATVNEWHEPQSFQHQEHGELPAPRARQKTPKNRGTQRNKLFCDLHQETDPSIRKRTPLYAVPIACTNRAPLLAGEPLVVGVARVGVARTSRFPSLGGTEDQDDVD